MYKIGLYEREITAFLGNSLSGYFNLRLASGVKDKTYAKAVVIDDGKTTYCAVAVDACWVSDELIKRVGEKVFKYTGIKKENITVSATHSHTAGPGDVSEPDADKELETAYIEFLYNAVADTIILAYQKRENACIKLSIAEINGSTFSRNYLMKDGSYKTNPGVLNPNILHSIGEIDPFAPVLFIENEKGENMGMVYSFGNHQDSVDGTEISGDWAGIVSEKMKDKFGRNFISIMFYGTAGNINQVDTASKDKKIEYFLSCYKDLGEAVYEGIIKSLEKQKELTGEIKILNAYKTYKNRIPTIEEIDEQQRIFDSVELPKGAKLDASSPKELFDACAAQRALNYAYKTTEYYRIRFQIIKIGKLMIFALPGEVFTQYGKKIKQAFPDNLCMFDCLANNKWTYMPAKECYQEGLYESMYGSAQFYPDDVVDIFDYYIELGKTL